MNLDAIQSFVAAAERGSFAAVARARGVAPSSVSRLVAELEGELEVRLFQRTTRRLSLTEAGRAYLDRIAPLLEELEQAHDQARDLDSGPSGVLRIAVTHEFAQVHFVKWLPELHARYPQMRFDVVLDASYTDLVAERIDVAVRLGRVDTGSSVARKLCEMPRVIVASPGRIASRAPLKPEILAREPCLLFPHEGFDSLWKLRCRRARTHEIVPREAIVAANGLLLRGLAVAGEGFALLPRWLCADELASGALVDAFPAYDVTGTEFGASISVVYPSRSYLPLKVRAFVDFLTELFRDGPPWERARR